VTKWPSYILRHGSLLVAYKARRSTVEVFEPASRRGPCLLYTDK
jgi:hypothetical protein